MADHIEIGFYQDRAQRWRVQANGRRSVAFADRVSAEQVARRLETHKPKTAAQFRAVTGLTKALVAKLLEPWPE